MKGSWNEETFDTSAVNWLNQMLDLVFCFTGEWVVRREECEGLYDSEPTKLWKDSNAPMNYLPDRNLVEERLLCFGHLFFSPSCGGLACSSLCGVCGVCVWVCVCVCVCVCKGYMLDNYQLIVLCSFSLGTLQLFINLTSSAFLTFTLLTLFCFGLLCSALLCSGVCVCACVCERVCNRAVLD